MSKYILRCKQPMLGTNEYKYIFINKDGVYIDDREEALELSYDEMSEYIDTTDCPNCFFMIRVGSEIDVSNKVTERKAASWDDTFMVIAETIAKRSKDPNTKVGAVIVDKSNRVISLGYNGLVSGMNFSHIKMEDKNQYMIHAEANALLQVDNRMRLEGATVYVTLSPCQDCAQALAQTGIKRVVYKQYRKYPASERIFEVKGIKFEQFSADK